MRVGHFMTTIIASGSIVMEGTPMFLPVNPHKAHMRTEGVLEFLILVSFHPPQRDAQ